MRKWISKLAKYSAIATVLLVTAFVALVFLLQPKPAPPLPFDTNAFVSTTKVDIITLPPKPTLIQRAAYLIKSIDFKLRGSRSITFGKNSLNSWGLKPLLNGCTDASATFYLMTPALTAATVNFPMTNPMNGEQFVSTVESTLQHNEIRWWDFIKQNWHNEPLALLRFRKQKVIVVLPKSEIADFLKTNNIDPANFQESR